MPTISPPRRPRLGPDDVPDQGMDEHVPAEEQAADIGPDDVRDRVDPDDGQTKDRRPLRDS